MRRAARSCSTRSRSLGVALRTEPIDLAAAINPVVAIFAAGQPFDIAALVTGEHGYNLPVALLDTVRSEIDFCFCHSVLCTTRKSNGSCDAVPHRWQMFQRGHDVNGGLTE